MKSMSLFSILERRAGRVAVRGAAAMVLALAGVSSSASAAVIYNFNLNGSLANEGSGPGTLVNNGGALGATGIAFPANGGPTLTGIAPLTLYTIDLMFSFANTTGYRKIIDFKNRSSDAGLYALNNDLVFFNSAVVVDNTTLSPGTLARVTLSRDATGVLKGYVDDALQFSVADATNNFGTALDTLHFFRDDLVNGGEASSGFVDYIRVFDEALTPDQAVVPSMGAVPEPATWAMMIMGFGAVGGAMRRRSGRKLARA